MSFHTAPGLFSWVLHRFLFFDYNLGFDADLDVDFDFNANFDADFDFDFELHGLFLVQRFI